MNDDLYEAEQIPKPGGCILKLKVAWMGWRGWMGMEGSFLPENLRKSNSWWNGGMHEWKGNEMTATEPTNPFSGAKCWFQGGVHGFFCCWFDVWRMDGRDINCMYFFVVKLTELQHLNQHVHLFAKKSTGLRIFALGSQASSVFSKFLWTQLGHLGCWFELPGQDSINIMWLACTFLVEGYDYFFLGGEVIGTNGGCAPSMLIDYPGVRRTGRETREPIRCSVDPSMVLPALVPASCRTKIDFCNGKNLSSWFLETKNIMRVGLTPRSRSSHHFLPQDVVSFGSPKVNLSSKQSCRWTLETLRLHSGSNWACPYDPARVSVARFWSIRLEVVKPVTVTNAKIFSPGPKGANNTS